MSDRATSVEGARRASGVVGHELASPLSALYTFIKLAARGDANALERIRECADRLRSIAELTRDFAHTGGEVVEVDLAELIERTARTLEIEVAVERRGATVARISRALATFVVTTALRAIADNHPMTPLRAHVVDREGRIELVIGAKEPVSWRAIEAWETPRCALAPWSLAAALGEVGGSVRLGGASDAIAVELPA